MTWPDNLQIRALSSADAARIAQWAYEGRWRIYDLAGTRLDAADGYHAVSGTGDGPLVGYCCLGAEARVPGLAADPTLLDIGVGMDPRRVGGGHGLAFGQTVLEFARRQADGRKLRAVVQSWNARSLRLAHTLGFVPAGVHHCVQNEKDTEYRVLIAD